MKSNYKKLLLIIGLLVLVSAFTLGASSAAKVETIKPQNDKRYDEVQVHDVKGSYVTFYYQKLDPLLCGIPDEKSKLTITVNVKKPKSVGIAGVIVPRTNAKTGEILKNETVKGYNKSSVIVNIPYSDKIKYERYGIGIVYNFKGSKVNVLPSFGKMVYHESINYWNGKYSRVVVVDSWDAKGELPLKLTFQAKKALRISAIKVFYKNLKKETNGSKVFRIGAKKVVTLTIPVGYGINGLKVRYV